MNTMWMVRAGRNAQFLDDFRDQSVVSVGWERLGDLSSVPSQAAMLKLVEETWPEWPPGKQRMSASQLYRFAHEMQVGDRVITYDPQARSYLLGDIEAPYEYAPGPVQDNPHTRKVVWKSTVDRDPLSTSAKNSLGAISTLFRVPEFVAAQIEGIASGVVIATPPEAAPESESEVDLLEDIEARAIEFIKDKISSLDWDEMQELVAGLLRAMGYKTRVSPAGPDRGKDIVASPDGFGFENPRIVVEVKHRREAMGSSAIRSFLGGRHQDDKGLYVSTGGFSKDAYYEAERANIPVTLLNLDGLVETLLEYYDKMDPEMQRLVPLKKVHWPL
jgi:restriction system protein